MTQCFAINIGLSEVTIFTIDTRSGLCVDPGAGAHPGTGAGRLTSGAGAYSLPNFKATQRHGFNLFPAAMTSSEAGGAEPFDFEPPGPAPGEADAAAIATVVLCL